MLSVVAPPAASTQRRIVFARENALAVTMAIARVDVRSSQLADSGLVWRGRVLHPTPVFSLRLHVVVTGASKAWRLLIRSEETGAVVETYTPSAVLMAPDGFWTRDIMGRAALIDLEVTSPGTAPLVVVDRYAYDTRPALQQAIHGIDGRLKIADASARVQALGRSVARLRIIVDGMGQVACTGFLVTTTLLLTNEHCVASDAEARSSMVDFGYEKPDTPTVTLRAVELMAVSHDLDYALLRLEREAPAQFRPAALDASPALVTDQQLMLVEHPLGGYKQVSLESCAISDTNMPGVTAALTDFGHRCDTLNGSSGSPVLDFASGRVVGLHHFGFDLDTNTLVNRAIAMDLVLADVRRRRPDIVGLQ